VCIFLPPRNSWSRMGTVGRSTVLFAVVALGFIGMAVRRVRCWARLCCSFRDPERTSHPLLTYCFSGRGRVRKLR